MIAETVAAFGGLDVLVNNAGTGGIGFIEQVQDSEVERMFGVNLTGVLRVTRAAASHLKKSGRGRIINISSVEGIRGSGVFPVYCMTKAGVLGLTRSNAIELARFGITVNAICPGIIDTELMAMAFSDPKFVNKAVKGIPMKRTGKPEDICGAVAFFASAESSYITGNIIVIDGGQTVKAL
jgi:3-oxoacyl-[acyl-carrier protein] reductase